MYKGWHFVSFYLLAAAVFSQEAHADICFYQFVQNPVQDGQDVILEIADLDTVLRKSGRESVEIKVPDDIYTESCPNPSSNSYCTDVACGYFRDLCLHPGTYSYRGIYDSALIFSCCDNEITVLDTGDPCLDECDALYWHEGSASGQNVEVVLSTSVPGTLYRVFPCYGTHIIYGYEIAELAEIRPEDLPAQCISPGESGGCVMPCVKIVDTCIEMDRSPRSVSYKFVPLDDTIPVKWSGCFSIVRESEEEETCSPEFRLETPDETVLPEPVEEEFPEIVHEAGPESGEDATLELTEDTVPEPAEDGSTEADGVDRVVFSSKGGGMSCSSTGAPTAPTFLFVLFLLVGLFCLLRDKR